MKLKVYKICNPTAYYHFTGFSAQHVKITQEELYLKQDEGVLTYLTVCIKVFKLTLKFLHHCSDLDQKNDHMSVM